ncbi:MAG: YveK family protein [Anaerolineae bacterium]
MDLKDYARILLKRGWIIVLVALVTAVSAVIFSKTQTPVYKAHITLLVEPARPDWGLANTIKTLLRNYSLQIYRRTTAQEVVDRLQLDIPPDRLLSRVAVDPDEANLTIQIEAKDYDPFIAQEIVQTLAEIFVEERDAANLGLDKRDRLYVSIRDNALPGSIYSPKTKLNALAGGILGVLLGGLIVFFLEWLEADVIRSTEDVERYIGVVVVGTIPTITAKEAAQSSPTVGQRLFRRGV